MNMKKFSALLLALSMVLSLAACGGKSTDQPSDDSQRSCRQRPAPWL